MADVTPEPREPASPFGEPDRLPAPPANPDAAPRWPALSVLLGLVLGIAATVVGVLVVTLVAAAAGAAVDGDDVPAGVTVAQTVVQDLGFVAAAVFMARLVAPVAPWQFGLRSARFWRAAGITALFFALFVGFSAGWIALVGAKSEDELPFDTDGSTAAIAATAVLVVLVAPLCEELFFRGFMFRALRGAWGVVPAALATGLLFGGAHAAGTPAALLPILAVLGIGFCLLYELTGSLWPSICAHALNNTLALASIQGWDWQVAPVFAGALVVFYAIARGLRAGFGPGPASVSWPGRVQGGLRRRAVG